MADKQLSRERMNDLARAAHIRAAAHMAKHTQEDTIVLAAKGKWPAITTDVARAAQAKQNEATRLLLETDAIFYRMGNLHITIGTMPNGLKHLSASTRSRYPTWDELHYVRYNLLPQIDYMALMFPPEAEYVNLHPNMFHLFELPQRAVADLRQSVKRTTI